MLRQSITRPAVIANRALCQRSFSAVAPRMGEGDTGAPRSGGAASGYVSILPLYLNSHMRFVVPIDENTMTAVAFSALSTALRVNLVPAA